MAHTEKLLTQNIATVLQLIQVKCTQRSSIFIHWQCPQEKNLKKIKEQNFIFQHTKMVNTFLSIILKSGAPLNGQRKVMFAHKVVLIQRACLKHNTLSNVPELEFPEILCLIQPVNLDLQRFSCSTACCQMYVGCGSFEGPALTHLVNLTCSP